MLDACIYYTSNYIMSLRTHIYVCLLIHVNDACERECFFKSLAA